MIESHSLMTEINENGTKREAAPGLIHGFYLHETLLTPQ